MKIKIDKTDKLFSQYIRMRGKWKCARCGAHHPPPTSALHCAHMFTRGKKSTRWDVDNAIQMCYGCHRYIDSHPFEKIEFFTKLLGQDRFDRLRLRSNIPQKVDEKMVQLWLKTMIAEMEKDQDGEVYGKKEKKGRS